MYRSKLKFILEKNNLTLRQAEEKTGIPYAYFSHMLTGKRPVSEKNWLKILTAIEGQSISSAKEQLARWQIEDARLRLPRAGAGTLRESRVRYGPTSAAIDRMSEHQLNLELAKVAREDSKILGDTDPRDLGEKAKRSILKAFYSM